MTCQVVNSFTPHLSLHTHFMNLFVSVHQTTDPTYPTRALLFTFRCGGFFIYHLTFSIFTFCLSNVVLPLKITQPEMQTLAIKKI